MTGAYDKLLTSWDECRKELSELRDWRATVTAALRREGGAFYADVPTHIRTLRAELDRLRRACRIVMQAFDDGVFVRSTSRDNNPKWAIELLPYIQALNDITIPEEDPELPVESERPRNG